MRKFLINQALYSAFLLFFSCDLLASKRFLTHDSELFQLVDPIVGKLIETEFSALKKKKIKIKYYLIESETVYLASNFGGSRVFLGTPVYHIGLNKKLLDETLSYNGLRAILVHELSHTLDYASGSTLGKILPIGVQVLTHKGRIQYERKTDLKTVLRGYGQGLIEFKLWQYPQLEQKQLRIKKAEYLTPKEVKWIIENSFDFDHPLIKKWFKKKIPSDFIQFKNAHASYLGQL
ncbi:MAG: hypothetical protein ACPGJV_04575 [Bacteriovoracaceae bacterium]